MTGQLLTATYNNNWLKQRVSKGEVIKYLYFWGHQPSHDGVITQSCLSQWWAAPFEVEGRVYATAEHWMMAQKALLFGDEDAFAKTLRSVNPGEVKEIGRSVRNFDAFKWEANKYRIVVEGNLHKFRTHETLEKYLTGTSGRVIVEASPVDTIWGVGLAADNDLIRDPNRWKGENLLGYALMEVRDKLNKDSSKHI